MAITVKKPTKKQLKEIAEKMKKAIEKMKAKKDDKRN